MNSTSVYSACLYSTADPCRPETPVLENVTEEVKANAPTDNFQPVVHFAILSAKNLERPPALCCFAPSVINAFAEFKFRKISGKYK